MEEKKKDKVRKKGAVLKEKVLSLIENCCWQTKQTSLFACEHSNQTSTNSSPLLHLQSSRVDKLSTSSSLLYFFLASIKFKGSWNMKMTSRLTSTGDHIVKLFMQHWNLHVRNMNKIMLQQRAQENPEKKFQNRWWNHTCQWHSIFGLSNFKSSSIFPANFPPLEFKVLCSFKDLRFNSFFY